MEPYALAEDQADAAGRVLAAAFAPAALAAFIFPDPVRRARIHPITFAGLARLTLRFGAADAIGDPPRAVALWWPPDSTQPTADDYAAAGILASRNLCDHDESARLGALNHHFDERHERLLDRSHWYLSVLGVEPAHQGRGLGRILVQHRLDRIEPGGASCYLDSAEARNLPFYERFGFRVVESGLVPNSNVQTWALLRDRP